MEYDRLPNAELNVMRILWEQAPPVTTSDIMRSLPQSDNRKAPTIINLLSRLVVRGFIRTEKDGKKRYYYPLIEKNDYVQYETKLFMQTVHGNSLPSFIKAFSPQDSSVTQEEIKELLRSIDENV